jgi:hypothetical protein
MMQYIAEETKSVCTRDISIARAVAASLLLAKVGDQPKYPSQMKELQDCGIYTQWDII